MRIYEQRQIDDEHRLRDHYQKAYSMIPALKELDQSISSLSVEKARRLLDGDSTALSSLKEDLHQLIQRKKSLLEDHGLSEDYLELSYTCPDCKDTGYIGNKKCHCFRKAIIRLLYEQSNIKELPYDAGFKNFRLDFYSSSYYDKKTGRSARVIMEDTLKICHQFIDTFGAEFRNLFFYGDVGVGKTFLSTCIARELMEREFSVLYFSAPQLFNSLARTAFNKKDIDAGNMNEYIFNCDLLIIDDLGSEYTNAFIASQFFTCINERLLHRKSTIISTNLSLETLADLYTERSFSRITSSYTLLKIIGDDIRIKKKLEHREDNSCYVEQKES